MKKLKLSSDGRDTGSKKCKEATVAPVLRPAQSAFAKSLESEVRL